MAKATCPASVALQRKLTQALGTCTACAPQVEYLESLAGTCPEIDQQITELRIMLDHLERMAKIGLRFGADGSGLPDAGEDGTR